MEVHLMRFPLISVLFFCLFTLGTQTSAATFTYTFDGNESNFTGTDGWDGAYCADTWTTALNGGVFPLTDDGCSGDSCTAQSNCGYEFAYYANCQDSDPLDNHIHIGSSIWKDYVFSSRFKNTDDDTIGFVFRYKNSGQFYLLYLTRSLGPDTQYGCSVEFVGTRLYRIYDKKATQLATSAQTYTQGTEHAMRITVIGNQLDIEFDANGDTVYSDSEKIISVTDANPLPAGKVGFYAWENGASVGQPCADGSCWFDDVEVDVIAIVDDGCNGITWEGVCDGNTLKYCQNGQLKEQDCQCCFWFEQAGYNACGPEQACNGCVDECDNPGVTCNAASTHEIFCGQADDDPCNDLVFSFCVESGFCNPATNECSECSPACANKECGDDGCGSNCGECPEGNICTDAGTCLCTPNCTGKNCGDDGCGGSCGACPVGIACNAAGVCQCLPDCAGKDCGSDGCGSTCGLCSEGFTCTKPGICECIPVCDGKACGDNGCGGICGTCAPNEICDNFACLCVPSCEGKVCGTDGCGGTCGSCPDDQICSNVGVCICEPSCENKSCGDDGCGGVCGICMVGQSCLDDQCVCVPKCENKECGPDLCGGTCGVCEANEICEAGLCNCVPECAGNECGPDGCSGLCGECPPGEDCEEGICEEPACEPKCIDKQCGPDGCGGTCGECGAAEVCDGGTCICTPSCDGIECGDDGCGGNCGECEDGFHCNDGLCEEGECEPACDGKECGDDGCNGLCGECDDGMICKGSICTEKECYPNCIDKECGDDGCGGTCGICNDDLICLPDGTCEPPSTCDPKAKMQCVDGDVYWLDSCDEQGDLVAECNYGCDEGSCLQEPEEDISSIEPESDSFAADSSSAAGGDGVTFNSGTKSGGCSTSHQPAATVPLLLLVLGVALVFCRRISRRMPG
jgi:hypothetical protein